MDFTLGLDSNTNGIPDWWGLQHFGGATNAVAAADPDGDGQTNLQEYLDGTDPNDSNSFRATASGSIVYTGGQGGPVYVDVYDWQTNLLQRIECEGDAPWFFETASLPGYSTMALTAFRDSNTNGVADLETEAHARFLIPGMIPTEGIHLILKDPDSSGDGYPNWSSSDPGAFIDNNGNGIGDGFEPNPDIPGYWVSAYTEIALPTTVGPHLLDPGLPTNAVLTGLAFVGSGYSSFTVEGIISYDLPGYFFYEMQYRQLTNSLTDRRTGILSMYVENAELGDNCYASFKNPAPLILPPECNTATAVYSVHNFGITGITPISGISNHVGSIWLQDMVKFCEAKTGTNTSETVAVTMGHGDDLSLTNLLSTVLGLPTLTWQVNGDGGSIMATPPLPGAPYGKILVGVNNHTNSINSAPNWEEQGIQPVVELDTSWLRVGHVDEAIMFISTNQYLVASPWLAADLLHAEIAAGNETNTMWFGVGPVSMRTYTISFVVIDDNSGSPKITALSTGLPDSVNPMDIVFTNHLFTTGDVLRVNDEILRVTSVNGSTVTVSRAQGGRPAQAHDEGARIYALSDMMKLNLPVLDHPENSVAKRIETLTNTLHADVGSAITPIPMPVLFEWVDNYLGKGFVAGTPNIVNCLVMSPTRIIMAEPGIACFKNYAISQVPQTTDH
ncbi:MAG: protein-arginine deiminase family protein, partial [Kiritimatiellia bacterium]|nr:protein-arginine deiminase family protein [Kiritimatiellia bacterium]